MKLIAAATLLFLAGPPAATQIGSPTFGLAAGGGSVWVGGLGSGDVIRIDPATGKVLKRVTVGARVFNLAAAPGAVWAIDNALSTAVRIDTKTAKVTARVPVGFQPYDIEWGFGSAWVANAGDGTVWRITNGKVVKKIKVGTEPNGLTAYRGALWVSDHTLGKVVRIDPATNKVTGTVKLPGADWVTGLGGSIYVSQETNVVSRVSVAHAEGDRRREGGAQPARLGDRRQAALGAVHRREPDRRRRPRDDACRGAQVARPAARSPCSRRSGHAWVTQSTGTKLLRL